MLLKSRLGELTFAAAVGFFVFFKPRPLRLSSLCKCAEVMEGNQEVITLVATCMALLHGCTKRGLNGDKRALGSVGVRKLVASCMKHVLHVGAYFNLSCVMLNNGLQIGSAQPGSVEMLSFLRLCHAV